MRCCFFLLVYCLSSMTCSELLSRHKRMWIIDSFEMEEENPGPFPYVLGRVNIDRNYRVFFELFGEGVNLEPTGVLSIHKDTGTLYVHKAVDYETIQLLKLGFNSVKTDSSLDTKLGIEISIRDINDNPPRFQRDLYELSVDEADTQGSHLLTVLAYDRDQRGTPNSTFHYEIKSVSPNSPDTEFFIDGSGAISFKGCLDYEVADMFEVLVEAKDHGEVVSLSSSTTVMIHVQDGNNYLPIITGQTGSRKVKEDETGSSPLRLHVTDKDSPGSRAWRARYTIHGDKGEHFRIETDPATNDGILTVVKPLDYEKGPQRELSISVENEAPYFSCKVKERTRSGLWKVDINKESDAGAGRPHSADDDTHKGGDAGAGRPHSVKVVIEVEDVNDPPVFSVDVIVATVEENAPTGTWVKKVTAVDHDTIQAKDFVYKIGNDPAGWVTVDPHTGDITTVKPPDRESPHVVDGLYTILLHAVDDGKPPMTGTATLHMYIADQNDNIPQPTVDYVTVCVSDGPSTTNITAFDRDDDPFGGPFSFELLGDVEGEWELNPSHGYTAGLVKQPNVYAGPYTITLKISDMQGEFGVYNLSVTVCSCSVLPNCLSRRHTAEKADSAAIGIVFASLFLLLLALLGTLFISRKTEFTHLQSDSSCGDTLVQSNTENPGTDCQVPTSAQAVPVNDNHHDRQDGQHETGFSTMEHVKHGFIYQRTEDHWRKDLSYQFSNRWNQVEDASTMNLLYRTYSSRAGLLALLHWRLASLQDTENELLDYEPHVYAEEGEPNEPGGNSELENIAIPDDESFQKALKNLDARFNQLASVCKPPNLQN
ncbi:cadherin-like protein 26 [Mugil cephalus]|uniref:cadherin-like protein 26 n=1 Tax=Mugil cephalus TaxID=48193 RepID=UPI001FB82B8F|nr:cadherin-like protein 26 [Mugil cephalus]